MLPNNKEAYTDARQDRAGLFEQAAGSYFN